MPKEYLTCLVLLLLSACAATTPSPTSDLATPAPAVSPTVGSPTPTPQVTIAQPAPTMLDTNPAVTIGAARFLVEVVATPELRAQGLSGRPALMRGTGMLFVFEQEGPYGFWMKEMQFPLDLVWISNQCVVVDVTLAAPAPTPGQSDLPVYMPKSPALFVLEINAGEATSADVTPGKRLTLTGSLAGQYGC